MCKGGGCGEEFGDGVNVRLLAVSGLQRERDGRRDRGSRRKGGRESRTDGEREGGGVGGRKGRGRRREGVGIRCRWLRVKHAIGRGGAMASLATPLTGPACKGMACAPFPRQNLWRRATGPLPSPSPPHAAHVSGPGSEKEEELEVGRRRGRGGG